MRFINFVFQIKNASGMAKATHKIAWLNFWSNIVFALNFSLDKNDCDCIKTLTPPKPTSPLAIIVFARKEIVVFPRSNTPRVISIPPLKIDLITSAFRFVFIDIKLAKNVVIFKFSSMSINRKLITMKPPTIKTEISESYTQSYSKFALVGSAEQEKSNSFSAFPR